MTASGRLLPLQHAEIGQEQSLSAYKIKGNSFSSNHFKQKLISAPPGFRVWR